MLGAEQPEEQQTCSHLMVGDMQGCGRPIYDAPAGVDRRPLCLMHSRDPAKNTAQFGQEINAVLDGTSKHNRAKEKFDFTGFVFPEETQFDLFVPKGDFIFAEATFLGRAVFNRTLFLGHVNCRRATFEQDADFGQVKFTRGGDFSEAKFNRNARFWGAEFACWPDQPLDVRRANFAGVTFGAVADFQLARFLAEATFYNTSFAQQGDFTWARFTRGASFGDALFAGRTSFDTTVFGEWIEEAQGASAPAEVSPAIADFRGARIEQPLTFRFYQINKKSSQGLRARFVDCATEGVYFEDARWHLESGRMVLQDELDSGTKAWRGHELVATAYRRLVNNFDKARAYDLAEDCYIGAMEMKRLNPQETVVSRVLVTLYKWLSLYGSSYRRALGVLGVFVLAFALLFPVFGLKMADDKPVEGSVSSEVEAAISWSEAWRHPNRGREMWGTLKAGLWATVETATFQRNPTIEPANTWAQRLGVIEIVLIPGQVALFFLALRRRFRR